MRGLEVLDFMSILEELQRGRQHPYVSYWGKELLSLEKYYAMRFRETVPHPLDRFDVWLGRRFIDYRQYIQRLVNEVAVKYWFIPSTEILRLRREELAVSFRERVVKVYVDVSKLFSNEVVERLLRGERAEDIAGIPKDLVEELELENIANRVVGKLLKDLGVDATSEFKHALREWLKLWMYEFLKAAESVE